MRVSPLKAGHSNLIEAGNNPINYTDPAGLLQRDSSGNIIFVQVGQPRSFEHKKGTSSTGVDGWVFGDDGTAIWAVQNLDGPLTDPGMDTNCHGYTFADGDFWIPPSQVSDLLKADNYKKVGNPAPGDAVVYHDKREGVPTHSAKVILGYPTEIGVGIYGNQTDPSYGPLSPGKPDSHAPGPESELIITVWRK